MKTKIFIVIISIVSLLGVGKKAFSGSEGMVRIYGPSEAKVNETVTYEVRLPYGWALTKVIWEFGDGTFVESQENSINHTLEILGDFTTTATVTIENYEGNDVLIQTVQVSTNTEVTENLPE